MSDNYCNATELHTERKWKERGHNEIGGKEMEYKEYINKHGVWGERKK
jgi:hypothetical protein